MARLLHELVTKSATPDLESFYNGYLKSLYMYLRLVNVQEQR